MKSRFWLTRALIFFIFLLITIVATYPLIFKMKSHVYGYPGDPLGLIWLFWWLKYTGINHISPLFCSLLAAPWGVDYSQIEIYKVSNFFAKHLSLLTNEVFTYNLMILASFLLAPVTMYFLVYYFTRNKLASMVSGIIYGFSPYHFTQATQHLGLASIQWMPLYLLGLFLLNEKREYKYALLTPLTFSLVVFTDYHHTYFMLTMTTAFVLWGIWQVFRRGKLSKNFRSSLKTAGVIMVAIVGALALILPFTYHPFQNMFVTSGRYVRPLRDLFGNCARPLGYLLPSQDNPFFGRFTERFIKNPLYGGHPTEHTLYLGWVGIVLSIVAIRKWRRENRRLQAAGHKPQAIKDQGSRIQKGVSFFLFAGIVALIFSHSPYTEIGSFRILFPSYLMYKIAPMFRVYARFGIVVMLCVSVLAGIGLASILEKIKSAKKRRTFLMVILLLVFIEFAPTLPAPMVNAVDPPPVYEWLSKREGDFIIAEYPLEDDVEYLFWQRIHQKRLVNGALPGTYADEVRKEIVDILKPETPGILRYLGAKYIIFHPDKYLESEDVPVIGEVPDVSKQKGLRLVKTFADAQVYEVIAEPLRPKVENRGMGRSP